MGPLSSFGARATSVVVASLVELGSGARGLQYLWHKGSTVLFADSRVQAQPLGSAGLVASWDVGSSLTRDQTRISARIVDSLPLTEALGKPSFNSYKATYLAMHSSPPLVVVGERGMSLFHLCFDGSRILGRLWKN